MTDKAPNPAGDNVLPIATKKAPPKKAPKIPTPPKSQTAKRKHTKKVEAKTPEPKAAAPIRPDDVPRAPSPKRPVGRPKTPTLAELVEQAIVQGSGWAIIFAGATGSDQMAWDAQVMLYQAAPLSRVIERTVAKNPRMKKAVEAALAHRDGATTLAVLAGTALPILAAHGVIPVAAAELGAPKIMRELGTPPEPTPRPTKDVFHVKQSKAASVSPSTTPAAMASAADIAAGTVAVDEMSPQQAEVAARLRTAGILPDV